jgi:hypothetical protein
MTKSPDPAFLLSQSPALYRRLLYKGFTRYTSIATGQQTLEYETIVIVQSFFRNGDTFGMIPKYKLGYVNGDGSMGLKLSLQAGEATGHKAVVPAVPLAATFSVDGTAGVKIGGLYEPYEHAAHGRVEMWSKQPWTDEICWRYTDFWGLPIQRPFNDNGNTIKQVIDDKTSLFVNGWGQKTGNHILRTMNYSRVVDGEPETVLVRSSNLEAVQIDEQESEFDTFYDP